VAGLRLKSPKNGTWQIGHCAGFGYAPAPRGGNDATENINHN
jgi:hypothetical protein